MARHGRSAFAKRNKESTLEKHCKEDARKSGLELIKQQGTGGEADRYLRGAPIAPAVVFVELKGDSDESDLQASKRKRLTKQGYCAVVINNRLQFQMLLAHIHTAIEQGHWP